MSTFQNNSAHINGGTASSVGGYIDVTAVGDNEPTLLDVGAWRIVESFEETPIACSGNLGATTSRRTGYSYQFQLNIVWDMRNPPDTLLRDNDNYEIVFWFGDILNSGVISDSEGQPHEDRFYWAPGCKLDSVTPILDASNKRVVRGLVTGHMVSHIFLLPDQGDLNDRTTVAGAYSEWWDAQ